ncbi:hypothetical protein JYU34_012839 [Plutella xylostella]|uniref:Uncharacterized protein n=1 Tax=Plutella xylostella TaxID=51655 RepID=A0ABQ7QC94_PLUXY|nr:hypothetical protein JYU34_012839 [Plutella xylostella]
MGDILPDIKPCSALNTPHYLTRQPVGLDRKPIQAEARNSKSTRHYIKAIRAV